MFDEKRLLLLQKAIHNVKTAIYDIVNQYRKLIDMASSNNKDFTKMCRVTDGTVDEKGNIYVTKSMLDKFATKFKSYCLKEAIYWIDFFSAINIFVENLINFEDPILLLKSKNSQLKYLYECWFGDIYDVKHEESLNMLTKEIQSKKQNINVNIFKILNTDEEEEDTLLYGLPF